MYYETARDLTARGYAVWVLDPAGQGGSERFPGPVDLGRSNGFGMDAAALAGLLAQVVRPSAGRPVVVAASGSSALTALLAAEHEQAPLDGLFLWDPVLARPADVAHAAEMTRWRLGGLRADGGSAWTRPTQDLSGRATLPAAWQLADPDLRMGGPAWEWIAAEAEAQREALDPGHTKRLRAPVLVQAARAARRRSALRRRHPAARSWMRRQRPCPATWRPTRCATPGWRRSRVSSRPASLNVVTPSNRSFLTKRGGLASCSQKRDLVLGGQGRMPRPFDVRSGQRAVFDALLDARARHGGGKEILEDQDRAPLTYTDVIRAAFVLGRKIAALTGAGERVGVLLPTSSGVVVTFYALHAVGRVPVMLNFTSGVRNLKRALEAAGVKRVLTSRRFLETAKLEALAEELGRAGRDHPARGRARLRRPWDKLYGLAAGFAPAPVPHAGEAVRYGRDPLHLRQLRRAARAWC